ncbi:pilin protein [Burkholderia ubonensis]|nr:pilin protein [Burkholderia ubonensis]
MDLLRCIARIFLIASVLVMPKVALALVIDPSNRNDSITAQFDRGAPSSDVVIWKNQSGQAYDSVDTKKYGKNAWVCTSSSDDTFGACTTTPFFGVEEGETSIALRFTEEKTKAQATINVIGIKHFWFPPGICGRDVFPSLKPISQYNHVSFAGWCNIDLMYAGGIGISARIPKNQLKNIPSGGKWTAKLKLNQVKGESNAKVSQFVADITLNVTDKNNIQVYLPEFTNATPVVDLKLRTLPNGSRLSGTSNVDMCLYDGYNSQSTWFDVTASDGLTIDRRDQGSYSVLLESDKSGAYASRVDYNASLTYAGKKIALPNNETVRLQGVNNSAGRTVSLPGIPVPVVCTPTPLTLETPEFQSVWKRPGKYSNKLTITFTPSSASL